MSDYETTRTVCSFCEAVTDAYTYGGDDYCCKDAMIARLREMVSYLEVEWDKCANERVNFLVVGRKLYQVVAVGIGTQLNRSLCNEWRAIDPYPDHVNDL